MQSSCPNYLDTNYIMTTARIENQNLLFQSSSDFLRAMSDGFFRVKIPSDLNMTPAKEFAETFTKSSVYRNFGLLDVVNGYFPSKIAQTVRFSLEQDYWNQCHVNQKVVNGPPNYSPEIQEVGRRMHEIGMLVLKNLLELHDLPKDIWFKATGGAASGHGSHYLLFNNYDPSESTGKEGLGAHKDWGLVTVLYATEPGLEAKIGDVWRKIQLEEGYFTINFGYSLEKLLPNVNASEHRVVPQKEKTRTSIAAFISSRVGPYKDCSPTEDVEGHVYNWDENKKELKDGITTIKFFEKLSELLYGSY